MTRRQRAAIEARIDHGIRERTTSLYDYLRSKGAVLQLEHHEAMRQWMTAEHHRGYFRRRARR